MASEWRTIRIADLGRVVTGRTPPGNDPAYFDGSVPFLTPSDIGGHRRIESTARSLSAYGAQQLARCLIPRGVAVSCIGWQMGKSVLIDRPTITNQQINSIIVNEDIADCSFVYYSLRLRREELFNLGAGGSRTPILNKGDFERLPFSLPPVASQRAIAHILCTLDDKIELNRRMNETMEAMARALFKSWFVDFDPVRAKAEGRDPGLPKAVADLFPAHFVESELGPIPEGWEVGVLENVLLELEVGGRPKGGVSRYAEGVPSVGAESIVGLGIFDYSKTKYVPREFFDAMQRGHVKDRDVLLYKDGGRPGEFEPHITLVGSGFPFQTCAINEHVYRIRAKETVGQEFLFFWLSSEKVMDEMRIKGTGVAIPGLNSTQVKSLTSLIPPPSVTAVFRAVVGTLVTRVLASCNESRTLATLRDTLLPKLVSGELRVKDAAVSRRSNAGEHTMAEP